MTQRFHTETVNSPYSAPSHHAEAQISRTLHTCSWSVVDLIFRTVGVLPQAVAFTHLLSLFLLIVFSSRSYLDRSYTTALFRLYDTTRSLAQLVINGAELQTRMLNAFQMYVYFVASGDSIRRTGFGAAV